MQGCDATTPNCPAESHSLLRNVVGYGAVVVVSLVVFTLVYGSWRLQLSHPWSTNDYWFTAFQVQSMFESGWYNHHPRAGMPLGSDLLDFPIAEGWHFLLMNGYHRLFGLNAIESLNLHLLLTFPLTAVSCYFALRRLGCGRTIGFAIAQLYAFPYFHFFRLPHAFLAAYYTVPLASLILIRLSSEPGLLIVRDAQTRRWRFDRSWASVGTLAAASVLGSSGIYYAFFTCFFLILVAAVAIVRQGRWHAAAACALIIAAIGVSGFANVWPNIQHKRLHGPNELVGKRYVHENEIYGLRTIHLFLPPPGHPLWSWEHRRIKYETVSPSNEAVAATLGVVALAGFLSLMAWPFLQQRISGSEDVDRSLALLNLAGFLLATTGGFSVVVAMWLTPQIRASNRISVFLLFFALAAVALAVQRLMTALQGRRIAQWLILAGVLIALPLALFDQNPKNHRKPGQSFDDFAAESAFFQEVEATLPTGAMVCQLPYQPFPESPTLAKHVDYDHFRGVLLTKTLRFSYGACKGRRADLWQKQVFAKPTPEMVGDLMSSGFRGICVDRFGYEDGGAAIERELTAILASPPSLQGGNGRHIFYALPAVAKTP